MKIQELKIKNPAQIYYELATVLAPYREKPAGSFIFIVEGTKEKPIIGIKYPGRKVRKRELKKFRSDSALWANLFDFEVIPFENGQIVESTKFTFENMLRDFEENKRSDKRFWDLIEELYKHNTLSKVPSDLPGIETSLYLYVLKWIWLQEDFNYKLSYEDVGSSIKYVLETRTGVRTGRGAGRAKFFAALILLKNFFTFDEVKKIIPLY